MAYDFSLDRKAAITLSIGSVALLLLAFFAGLLTGIGWQSERDLMIAQRQQPARPAEITTAKAVPPAKEPDTAPTAPPGPSATATAAAEPPAIPPAPPAKEPAAPATAPAGGAAAPATSEPTTRMSNSPGVQLTVQVGAFLDKANAEKLAERLKSEGYSSQIIVGGHAPRQWNIVRVGPYHDWDEASEIAAALSRDQPTPAVVRPTR